MNGGTSFVDGLFNDRTSSYYDRGSAAEAVAAARHVRRIAARSLPVGEQSAAARLVADMLGIGDPT